MTLNFRVLKHSMFKTRDEGVTLRNRDEKLYFLTFFHSFKKNNNLPITSVIKRVIYLLVATSTLSRCTAVGGSRLWDLSSQGPEG